MTNDGPGAGGDAAADDRRMGEWQILPNPDHLLGRTDDKFRKRSDPRHLVDRLAVEPHARSAVVHHPARRIVMADAQDAAPGRAVAAVATMRPEREDHMIARLDRGHARPLLHHDAGGLVSEHHRQRQRPVAAHDVPVAHAYARGLNLHPHLVRLRRFLLKIENLQWLVNFGPNPGSHVVFYPSCRTYPPHDHPILLISPRHGSPNGLMLNADDVAA